MNKYKKSLPVILFSIIGIHSLPAYSHGYVNKPAARQIMCKYQGGGNFWNGGLNNAACKQIQGSAFFTTPHGVSHNVTSYDNLNSVKASIPRDKLCSANNGAYTGLDTPHPDWIKTRVEPGSTLQYEFMATVPHDPSFWEFYITKPNFNSATDTLGWEDLELIHQESSLRATNGIYRTQFQLPSNLSGNAILYTRWQRKDSAGEGFYNCSDLDFGGDNSNNQDTWIPINQSFVSIDDQSLTLGDRITFRVFDNTGHEIITEEVLINSANMMGLTWAKTIAENINSQSEHISVGILSNGTVQLNIHDVLSNKVYSNDASISRAVMEVTPHDTSGENRAPIADAGRNKRNIMSPTEQSITLSGRKSSDPDGDTLSYSWRQIAGNTVTLKNKNKKNAQVDIPALSEDQTFTFELMVSDGQITDTDTVQIKALASNSIVGENPEAIINIVGKTLNKRTKFDGSSSSDSDGNIISYKWSLTGPTGENLTSQINNQNSKATYFKAKVAGEYKVSLKVTDDSDNVSSKVKTFTIKDNNDGGELEGLPHYPDGLESYTFGTKVIGTDGNHYQCQPFPHGGWCKQTPLYYAPGTGLAWQDAWVKIN